jgi:hypothetical protein
VWISCRVIPVLFLLYKTYGAEVFVPARTLMGVFLLSKLS